MRRGLAIGIAVVAGMLIATIAGLRSTASDPVSEPDSRGVQPNIVLVLMDDMRADDLPWMPTVHRELARAGTKFTRFYAPTPVCCPSRASLLRGQYPHNTGVLTNVEPDGGFAGFSRLEGSTLATWLDPTYETGYVGKYMNGYEGRTQTHVPAGWDFWYGLTRVYNYMRVHLNENGTIVNHRGINSPKILGSKAEAFLGKVAGPRRPFFLQLSFVTPHVGVPRTDGEGGVPTPYVPPRDRGSYAGPAHPIGPAYNEADMSDKTGSTANGPRLSPRAERRIAIQLQQRRESLASADRALRRVLTTLDREGELDNTYLIFTSDNGRLLGEHRIRAGKSQPYEPSARVPLLISGPEVPARNRSTTPAGMQDLAPTVLDIARVSADDVDVELDGRSVLPSLHRSGADRNRTVLLEEADLPLDFEVGGDVQYAPRRSVAETDWVYRAVVTRRWKLIDWVQQGTYELYDLRTDPHEVDNLAYDAAHRELRQKLVRRLEQLQSCSGTDCG